MIPNRYRQWLLGFSITLIYQIIVQSIWWRITQDNSMLPRATYYIFNFMAAFLCIYIGQRLGIERLKQAVCKGCFYSALVSAIGFVIGRGSGIRSTGFFNNPNQLGYYSLLILTTIAFFPNQLPKWQNIATIVISLWGNVISVSKASIIGAAGLAICYTIWGSKEKTVKKTLIQIFGLLAIFGVIVFFLYSDSSIITGNRTLFFLRRRILLMSAENDSGLGTGRGYDRVMEMGIHFLWGVGEGAYYRFRVMPGFEVHSTFANLLVSYGLLGLLSYIWIIGKCLIKREKSRKNLACFFGLFLYSFTLNGIRNTLLWILLAAVLQNVLSRDYLYDKS